MEQEMSAAEKRRMRADALEYALRAKGPNDTCDDVIEAAMVYGEWLVNGAPQPDDPASMDEVKAPMTALPMGLSSDLASRYAEVLLEHATDTGSWLDLPERLIELRRVMEKQS